MQGSPAGPSRLEGLGRVTENPLNLVLAERGIRGFRKGPMEDTPNLGSDSSSGRLSLSISRTSGRTVRAHCQGAQAAPAGPYGHSRAILAVLRGDLRVGGFRGSTMDVYEDVLHILVIVSIGLTMFPCLRRAKLSRSAFRA